MLNMSSIESICMGCFTQHAAPADPCPVCGYHEAAQAAPPHHLRPRSILNGKCLLGRVLGEGGFGITYVGWDMNLDVKIAIKEYYPNGFVTRETTSATTVQPFAGTQGDFFFKGRDRFVEEARSLAKFRFLPGIVAVSDFFQENGTAYIIMEYIDGQTMKGYLAQTGGKLPAAQVLDMMKPVMASLSEVHQSGMIHRDISPDNIMIAKNGTVKLLDFGAARNYTDSGNKSLSIMLKPGFAPEEQYRTRGVQGPWTDVYALCASIYKCITGVTPEESLERVNEDTLRPPRQLGAALTGAQEAALMKGLAVKHKDRFQTVPELFDALYGAAPAAVPVSVAPPPMPQHAPPPVPQPVPVRQPLPQPVPQPAPVSAVPQSMPVSYAPPPVKKPKTMLIASLIGGVVLVTAAVFALLFLWPSGGDEIVPVIPAGGIGDMPTPPGQKNDEDDWLVAYKAQINDLADTISQWDGAANEEIQRLLNVIMDANSAYIDVYMGIPGGTLIRGDRGDDWDLPDDYNVTERSWYILALSGPERAHVTEPYQDAWTGETLITVARAVVRDGRVIGVVAADIVMPGGHTTGYDPPPEEGYEPGFIEIEQLDMTVSTDETYLNLSYSNISDISVLSKLTKLEILYLDNNELTDISALSGLTNLRELYIYNNFGIKDISALENLVNLEILSIMSTDIDSIDVLFNLPKLTDLNMSGCRKVDHNEISRLTNLTVLQVGTCGIRDLGFLRGMTNLTGLNLYSNDVSDLSILENLTKLEKITLLSNPVTQAEVDRLREALPNCEIYLDRVAVF